LTLNNTTQTLYVDWVSKSSGACSHALEWAGRSALWKNPWVSSNPTYRGYMSNVIIESVIWPAEQVAWYYNQTKSQYWIS
jgi:hypothetical protein